MPLQFSFILFIKILFDDKAALFLVLFAYLFIFGYAPRHAGS